jgi:hypothetical protein
MAQRHERELANLHRFESEAPSESHSEGTAATSAAADEGAAGTGKVLAAFPVEQSVLQTAA